MPTYDYRCPDGHQFELFQRMTDPAPEVCEVCGEGPLERVLYPVAVHFKGSGFYSTDYGRRGKKKDGDASAGEAKDGKKPAGEKSSSEKASSEKAASTSSDS